MTNAAIGEQVGLSAPSVFERIRKLEQRGVIEAYTIRVNAEAVGKPLTAIIRITSAYDDQCDISVLQLRTDPDIIEVYNVAGEDCYVMKVKAAHPHDLKVVLDRIRSTLKVQHSVTMIALNIVKDNGPINVWPSAEPAEAVAVNGSANGTLNGAAKRKAK